MNKKLVSLLKCKNIVIPLYLIQNFEKLKLEYKEFLFLMYLYSLGDSSSFDPKRISDDTGFSLQEVMQMIAILSDKNYVDVKVIKNDKNISEEIISLEYFYNKISILMMDDIVHDNENSTSCFDLIQKEFGRTLSSIEYEIIKGWTMNGNSDELIMEAVKEAVYNNVNNLRYIDKILFEWGKKGIKTKEDVEKERKNYRRREEKEEDEEELFDYNWFEDDYDE